MWISEKFTLAAMVWCSLYGIGSNSPKNSPRRSFSRLTDGRRLWAKSWRVSVLKKLWRPVFTVDDVFAAGRWWSENGQMGDTGEIPGMLIPINWFLNILPVQMARAWRYYMVLPHPWVGFRENPPKKKKTCWWWKPRFPVDFPIVSSIPRGAQGWTCEKCASAATVATTATSSRRLRLQRLPKARGYHAGGSMGVSNIFMVCNGKSHEIFEIGWWLGVPPF